MVQGECTGNISDKFVVILRLLVIMSSIPCRTLLPEPAASTANATSSQLAVEIPFSFVPLHVIRLCRLFT